MNIKNLMAALTLPLITGSSILSAANANNKNCAPEAPVACNQDSCKTCYCLGPDNYGVNAPVCPITCNGDWDLSIAGFFWNAHQDGMEYAINNRVKFPENNAPVNPHVFGNILALNNLIDSNFENPNFKWDFGFKLGIGYCTTCDGWDFGAQWTWYRGKSDTHVETERDDNHTLMPIWSAYASPYGGPLFASDIETHWRLELNLIDLDLGRNFWTSKYLALRPHVGLRIAFINQDLKLQHKGGSWSTDVGASTPSLAAYNNVVKLENDFKGVGIRAGLDSTWNFGCGWALFGNVATSLVYGRFDVDYDESNREASSPHSKIKIGEVKDSFRGSRAMVDFALGVQWGSLICDCKYGVTIGLAWENHLFFDQNQMWRINRIGDVGQNPPAASGNHSGENVYHQRRGNLDTQGFTLNVDFAF